MSDLHLFVYFGLAALIVVWVVNILVGILSGERPRDTGRQWWELMFGPLPEPNDLPAKAFPKFVMMAILVLLFLGGAVLHGCSSKIEEKRLTSGMHLQPVP